jgi:hypothetical protein
MSLVQRKEIHDEEDKCNANTYAREDEYKCLSEENAFEWSRAINR